VVAAHRQPVENCKGLMGCVYKILMSVFDVTQANATFWNVTAHLVVEG
jgi:hypothetical protein